MNSSRIIGAALLLVAAGCLHAQGTAQHPAITGFDIDGTHAVSAGALRDSLATQPSGRWFWQEPQFFDEDVFANDKRRIARYYQARGYYDARVQDAQVVPDGDGRVKVRLRVDEGTASRVVSIDMPGIEGASEARAKLGKLPLQIGDVFTEAAYDASRAAILNALTTRGWARAEVDQHAQVDLPTHEVRITYTVRPGERYKFGAIFVAGAAAIPRARIREEAQLAVKPGATYDSDDVKKAQARVSDLGVFGGVRVASGAPDEANKEVPVVVQVREAPFRTIRAGPGFVFQLTRYELDAMVGWSHRNWLGGLRKLNLDLRAGYSWLPTIFGADKEGVVGLATADFTQPGVLTRNVDLNLHTEFERGLEQAFDFWAQRFRVGTPIKFGRTATIIPSLNLELYELTGQVGQADPATGSVLLLRTCPGDPCVLSYFEQRATIDLRDDPILTRNGAYFSVALQEGFSVFGAGSAYLRLLPEARLFLSLPVLDMVVAARARMGIARPLGGGDVPIVAKFTSGGPNLMRGYYSRALSPQIYYNPCAGTGKDPCFRYLPVGGNGLLDGSIELRFPISGHLGGALFLDFGNVTVEPQDALRIEDLQYAVGVGVRYLTVFGPIRLDVAARIPKPNGDQPTVQVLDLASKELNKNSSVIGYHAYPIVSVHLSIGEAF